MVNEHLSTRYRYREHQRRVQGRRRRDRRRPLLGLGVVGTMSILVGGRGIDAPKGSFVLAPAGMTHDFENRTAARAGILNFSIPGDFEKDMSAIAQWFAENPPKDACP
jgi:hypothetical protein